MTDNYLEKIDKVDGVECEEAILEFDEENLEEIDEEVLEVDESTLVKSVKPGSIAEQIGIEAGDIIALINHKKIIDIFDYRLSCVADKMTVTIVKPSEEVWEVEIEKEEDDDLGIEFEYSLLSEEKSCRNKCIFCFIDQLPKGLRETLYFKDDDPRLSFLTGNYVSLTNVNDEELRRIIKFRLSPINVSVHTTNPELRCKMLNNRFAGDVLRKIKMITDAKLEVNAQIVLCKNYNDGDELLKTIEDLAAFYPGVKSVSVVPVGITKFRDGLTPLESFEKEDSLQVLQIIENLQKKYLDNVQIGSRFVYAADEFYINAEKDIPNIDEYEEFPQIENGVGMVAALTHEVKDVCKELLVSEDDADALLLEEPRKVTAVCGEAMYRDMHIIKEIIEKTFHNLEYSVLEAKNYFFGGKITVTGLLTGSDVLKAFEKLKAHQEDGGHGLGDAVLISDTMLRDGEDVFLDNMTLDEFKEKVPVPVLVVEHLSGADLVSKATDLEIEVSFDEEDDESDCEYEYDYE